MAEEKGESFFLRIRCSLHSLGIFVRIRCSLHSLGIFLCLEYERDGRSPRTASRVMMRCLMDGNETLIKMNVYVRPLLQ